MRPTFDDPSHLSQQALADSKARWEREEWLEHNGRAQAVGLREFLVVALLVIGVLSIARHQGYAPSDLWAVVEQWVGAA